MLAGATSVAGGVLRVDQSGRVKGLVNIADVVDDHSEGEGALIGVGAELVRDLLSVGCVSGVNISLKELGVGIKGSNDVLRGLGEGKVVEGSALLVEVGLVDVMPVALEGVALSLDVVGEGSALGEGVVLLLDEVGVVLGKDSQIGKGGIENGWVLVLKNGLSSPGDYKKKEAG